jgi:hypothetical protein
MGMGSSIEAMQMIGVRRGHWRARAPSSRGRGGRAIVVCMAGTSVEAMHGRVIDVERGQARTIAIRGSTACTGIEAMHVSV